MSTPAMPKAVLQFFSASHGPDPDAWADSFAEDGRFHDPVGTPPITGREEIRAKLRAVAPKFDPFLGLTPLEAYTIGNAVAVSWRGAVVSVDGGHPVNWAGITIFTLNPSGLIQDAAAYFNHDVFAVQLKG